MLDLATKLLGPHVQTCLWCINNKCRYMYTSRTGENDKRNKNIQCMLSNVPFTNITMHHHFHCWRISMANSMRHHKNVLCPVCAQYVEACRTSGQMQLFWGTKKCITCNESWTNVIQSALCATGRRTNICCPFPHFVGGRVLFGGMREARVFGTAWELFSHYGR